MGPLRLNNETQIVAYGPRFVIYQHEHESFGYLLYGFCKLYDFFIDNPSNVRNQLNQDRMSVIIFFSHGYQGHLWLTKSYFSSKDFYYLPLCFYF